MLYYEDIKLRRRRRGMYRRETSYIYVLGAKPLDEPLTNTGDTLQRCHITPPSKKACPQALPSWSLSSILI
jgi:hypothetical protein